MRVLIAMMVVLIGGNSSVAAQEETTVRALVTAEFRRHPRSGPEDLYKFLHQAAMGSEHAMHDTAGVRAWMVNELATMGNGAGEAMVDTIAPGGVVVRVNLRPWVAAGRSTDSLLAAFIATATAVHPDTGRLSRYLTAADAVVAARGSPFTIRAWRNYVATERGSGFPAAEHSRRYSEAYRPAYRVVAGPLIP